MDIGAANTAAARAFVDELVRLGVEHFCVSPGSRSTPITVAVAEHPGLRAWLHLDERTASFFALGLARATARPVGLVCTSGTAAANYHPAVAEADLSRVPLIVCTTDRPPRLRNVGAAQTINQAGMYGAASRLAIDAPVPSGGAGEDNTFRQLARDAVGAAMGLPPGPAHCNLPFEEPLIAAPAAHLPPHWTVEPPRPVSFREAPPSAEQLAYAAHLIATSRRPLIVAGPETGGLPAEGLRMLAERFDAPVLADILSGLRLPGAPGVVITHDVLVRDAPQALMPDLVLRFGGVPTSKPLNGWLERLSVPCLLVDYPGAVRDPDGTATQRLDGSAEAVVSGLLGLAPGNPEAGWRNRWLDADARVRADLAQGIVAIEDVFEGRVFTELANMLPAGSTLALGNSMPVRDADSFFDPRWPTTVACNRGANGIDGVTSSALGAAAAGGGPVVLVTGDISFEHDLTALWAAHRHDLDLTIVLVNNNGGGIFEFLPQSAHEDFFEEWFGTPHNVDFGPAIEMYGGRYQLATGWEDFRAAFAESIKAGGLSVIEVRTDRKRNVALHRALWERASKAAWSGEEVATAP